MSILWLLVGFLLGLIVSFIIEPRVRDWQTGRMVDKSAEWQAFKKAFPIDDSKK